MTKLRIVGVLLLGVFVAAGGCRGDDDDAPTVDGGPGTADAATGGDVTIQDVQNSSMAVGTPVTLRGVVVVAVDNYGGRVGNVYVMEPEGGPYSGVLVFGGDAAGLAVGDLVDVEGAVKDEFALSSDTSGRTLTELSPPDNGTVTITKVGDGTVPEPEVLDPWTLAAADAEAEKWDSVLIRFNTVAVQRAPHNVTQTDSTLLEMDVTGPYIIQSALTPFDEATAVDDCFASITGVGEYFFDYKVLPRSAADFVTGGSGCLYENDETLCGDEQDNDYDNLADCNDPSCQAVIATCTADTTVVAIQDGTTPTNASVVLSGVIVTAIDRDRQHLWVQDAGGAADWNGVYVYRGSAAAELAAEIVVGATVDVAGIVEEYFDATQIDAEAGSVSFVSGGATPEALTGVDPAVLASETDGEPYEHVLIKLENVPVVAGDLEFGRFTVGTTEAPLLVDDSLFSYDHPVTETCFAELTGVMNWTFDERKLLPRSADDLVGGGTCP